MQRIKHLGRTRDGTFVSEIEVESFGDIQQRDVETLLEESNRSMYSSGFVPQEYLRGRDNIKTCLIIKNRVREFKSIPIQNMNEIQDKQLLTSTPLITIKNKKLLL